MEKLITAEQFATYRDIGQKYDKNKAEECIQLAQSNDLWDKLGEFLFIVLANITNPDYKDLLDGDGKQEGLKSLLADYAYARYLYAANVNFTPFGVQQKNTQDSQAVDRRIILDMVGQAQKDAANKFRFIEKYLKENQSLFPEYSKHNDPNINTFQQRWSII